MKICFIALSQRRSCSFINSNKYSDYSKYEYLDLARLCYLGGAEVYSLDKRLPNDKHFSFIHELDIMDSTIINLDQFDAVIFINTNLTNIFGGYKALSEDYFKKIDLVNKYNGKLFFIFRDINYFLTNDKENKLNLDNKVYYISQSKNTNLILDEIHKNKNKDSCATFEPKDILFYPFEQLSIISKNYLSDLDPTFNGLFSKIKKSYIPDFNDSPEFDLMYAGSYRHNRVKDIKKYVADISNNINTAIMGGTDKYKADFITYSNINYLEAVQYQDFRNQLNRAKSVIALGDKANIELNCITQRIYEAIDSKVVSFIDRNLDKEQRALDNQELKDFLYVETSQELLDKVNKLKDESFRKFIIDLQLQDPKYNIDIKKYCKDFVKLLENLN